MTTFHAATNCATSSGSDNVQRTCCTSTPGSQRSKPWKSMPCCMGDSGYSTPTTSAVSSLTNVFPCRQKRRNGPFRQPVLSQGCKEATAPDRRHKHVKLLRILTLG